MMRNLLFNRFRHGFLEGWMAVHAAAAWIQPEGEPPGESRHLS